MLDDAGGLTFDAMARQARRVANHLAAIGVRPGDLVALQASNRSMTCALDLGIAATGAVCLAFPMLYRAAEIERLLAGAGISVAIVEQERGGHDRAAELLGLRHRIPSLQRVLTVGAAAPDCEPLDLVVGGQTGDSGTTRPRIDVDPGGPLRIFVTSGTEGDPKRLVFSHDALAGGIGAYMGGIGVDDSSRVLVLPPLSSGFGAQATFSTLARFGAALVVVRQFTAAAALAAIERHRPTHITAVPAMIHMLLAEQTIGDYDLSSVQVICTSGAPLSPALVHCAEQALGNAVFVAGYGCSDGALCQTALDDDLERVLDTIGRPRPEMCAIRILRSEGTDAEPGELGEICGRGPMSPLSYLDAPHLDRLYRFDDGWARSGDLGYLDDDGYLHVVDRLKDIIIRGGLNISPAELDVVLADHPAVAEAACFGIPDERLGERVGAAVTVTPSAASPTLEDLVEFLAARGLARVKLPEHLLILDAMPKNPAGKLLRRAVRDQALAT